jgi:hypothetical protein
MVRPPAGSKRSINRSTFAHFYADPGCAAGMVSDSFVLYLGIGSPRKVRPSQ